MSKFLKSLKKISKRGANYQVGGPFFCSHPVKEEKLAPDQEVRAILSLTKMKKKNHVTQDVHRNKEYLISLF